MDRLESYLDRVKRGIDTGTDVERDVVIARMRDSILETAARLEAKGAPPDAAIKRAIWRNSPFLCIPALIGYVLCFILPAVGLSLLFPSYAPGIALTAAILLFLVSGFIVGLWWSDPAWIAAARGQLQYLFFSIMLWPVGIAAFEAAKMRQWRELLSGLAISASMVALSLAGFYLGRTFNRLRARRIRPESEEA